MIYTRRRFCSHRLTVGSSHTFRAASIKTHTPKTTAKRYRYNKTTNNIIDAL